MKKILLWGMIGLTFMVVIWHGIHKNTSTRVPKTPNPSTKTLSQNFEGQLLKVMDGDTLLMSSSDQQVYSVRLNAIDAPELSQPYGEASKISLMLLCQDRRIYVEALGNDRYGRLIGRVRCDQTDVQIAQVAQGFAWVFDRYVGTDTYLYSYQEQAQKNTSGLWQDPHPLPPWEWRLLKK